MKYCTLLIMLYALSGEILFAKDILQEDFSAITKHEDLLIDKFYDKYGLGLFPHEKNDDTKLTPVIQGALSTIEPITESIRKGRKLYKKYIIPMIEKNFPELNRDKNSAYEYFLHKSYKETIRNIIFGDLTASLHNSKISDEANVFFGASHPYYDAIFDVDWEDAKGIYTRLDLVKRTSMIIQRNYDLPEPILPIEKMVIEITKGLERSLPPQNVELFFQELYKLNIAQIESVKQQVVKNIDADHLRRITFKKGGFSMVLYALLADHDFTREELDIYFLEGAFLQNLDDMNDIKEDFEEGGVTLAGSFLITPYELDMMTEVWYTMLDAKVESGIYDKKNVKIYKMAIDYFLNSSEKSFNEYFEAEALSKEGDFTRFIFAAKDISLIILKAPIFAIWDIASFGLEFVIPALSIDM